MINDIGFPGKLGFGVGIYPYTLPPGFSELPGTCDLFSDNYGNYRYEDGSIMCWIPAFYYQIGLSNIPMYAFLEMLTYQYNSVDIKPYSFFLNENTANASGYALHRAFKNGGSIRPGFMIDKYQCSNNSGTASSLKNGNPLSSKSDHNPFSGLTGAPANNYSGAITAAKTRGSQFHCSSRFQFAALALLSLAHGQFSSSTTNCAWYLANKNYPKGNNNNALADVDDTSVKWQSDGYLNCGKTGSAGYGGGVGNFFAKSTHNGQNSGVADLNGNMWEINLGITRPGSSSSDASQQNDASAFFILKESVDINFLTSGWSNLATGTEAWGNATHLATLYDSITLSHISNAGGANRYGNGTNQVLDSSVTGDGYRIAGTGIPKAGGVSGSGTNLFGADYFYEYHRANLCLISGGYWIDSMFTGVWSVYFSNSRTNTSSGVGLRAAAYL